MCRSSPKGNPEPTPRKRGGERLVAFLDVGVGGGSAGVNPGAATPNPTRTPDYHPSMAYFEYEQQRLAYTIHGGGPRTTILMPGLLLSQKMQAPLARELAKRGNRVVTFDPLGHGRSDRPRDMWRYSMSAFAKQAVALMDHLELDQAIVGGTSLGANITLEVAALAPERLRAMVIEMPVLDNAIPACAAAFTPLLFALTFGEPVMSLIARGARAVPRNRVPAVLELGLDWFAQDPGPSGAVLQGIIFGRTAPHRIERQKFEMPALVIGHPRDPVHPFSDADMLAHELPNARLIDANSIIELRMRPARLTAKIADFVEECWADGELSARAASAA
jgi:pimeloyl-ACP methyl ester carboxylesterase